MSSRLNERLDRLYANRFSRDDREVRRRVWRVLASEVFGPHIPPGATVLDVGAGYCDLINHVRAGRRIAVDLNPEMPASAEPGVETHVLPLDRLGEVIEPAAVDVAIASNIFEHMPNPDALLDVLAALRGVIRPGGRLIVMQPNVRAVGGRFWDFFDHTLPLTERGMAEALRVAGFEIAESRARFLPYTFKSRLPAWVWLVRLYLALPPAQWLLGKQMFVIATRPDDRSE
jgi:SAM-dependent methyltransferase